MFPFLEDTLIPKSFPLQGFCRESKGIESGVTYFHTPVSWITFYHIKDTSFEKSRFQILFLLSLMYLYNAESPLSLFQRLSFRVQKIQVVITSDPCPDYSEVLSKILLLFEEFSTLSELSVSNRVVSMIDDMLGDEQQDAKSKPMFQDYKKFKHGKEVSQEVEIQYLKQHLLEQALVHHKHVIHMTHDLLDPNPTNTVDFIMMVSRVYSTKNTLVC